MNIHNDGLSMDTQAGWDRFFENWGCPESAEPVEEVELDCTAGIKIPAGQLWSEGTLVYFVKFVVIHKTFWV